MEFDPSVIIETKRLRLRFLSVDDTEAIFNNINHDKEVLKYFIDKYKEDISEMTLDKTIQRYIEMRCYIFAIELKETKEVIGMILQCSAPMGVFKGSEVGYAIGKKYWNQGYTTEAMGAMIEFLFSLGVHKVIASYFTENIASKRVMEKCGMIHEGVRKDEVYYHDRYYDLDFYYLIR